MIRSGFWAAAAVALGAMPAQAQDARLVSRAYNPDQVIKLDGRLNVQTTISFSADEHIENVAVGDSDNWQIVPNKRADLLFVKPLTENARTNMTVVTDRRTYFFELAASPTSKPVYALRLTYDTPGQAQSQPQVQQPLDRPSVFAEAFRASNDTPAPAIALPAQPPASEVAVPVQQSSTPESVAAAPPARVRPAGPDWRERKAARDAKREADRLESERRKAARQARRAAAAKANAGTSVAAAPATEAASSEPGPASYPGIALPWRRFGAREGGPIEVRDDGASTFLRFAPGQKIPAIYSRDSTNKLARLAFVRNGDQVVIAGLSQQLVIGEGRKRVYLARDGVASSPALPTTDR